MSGKERVWGVLAGRPIDPLPVMPIIHTALAGYAGVPLGRYFTDAQAMTDATVRAAERLGLDGVQLSLGVSGEVHALGAVIEQPADAAPLLRQHLLSSAADLEDLRRIDVAAGGRMPMYHAALREIVRRIGDHTFVLSTLRGPLNITAQLRGVENALIDFIDQPDAVEAMLDFATDVAITLSRCSLECGVDGLIFGEATCSPNFISPAHYRRFVWPRHVRLIEATRAMGWRCVGLHVCGNILPILDDLIATGVDLLDVDYQVPADKAAARAAGRVTLRGNLDPIATFFAGSAEKVHTATRDLVQQAAGTRWILSSGCDIPVGTKIENVQAFVTAATGRYFCTSPR